MLQGKDAHQDKDWDQACWLSLVVDQELHMVGEEAMAVWKMGTNRLKNYAKIQCLLPTHHLMPKDTQDMKEVGV